MINGNNYDALTNNGIHQLFSDNFQGQQFTLQIIFYMPSKEEQCVVFLSDGFAWIKGQFVGEAKAMAYRSIDLKLYSVIKLLSEDIEVNGAMLNFKLKRILQLNTRVHNLIGEPIPYEDFKQKGCFNQVGSNKIQDAVNIFKIKQVKEMATGKVSGTIIAKVIRKPDKVNSFLNIIIEDEQQSQIQCCFFGGNVEKYYSMLVFGGWYRFQDPVLQANNRQGNFLQLKITDSSRVVKLKIQSEQKEVGILKTNTHSQHKPKQSPYYSSEIEFKLQDFLSKSTASEETLYYVIARVLKISHMNNGIGRVLNCVDRLGKTIEITVWKEYDSQNLQLNETYRFGFLRAKYYRGSVTLQSRKNLFTLKISQGKICRRSDLGRQEGIIQKSTIEGRLTRRVDKMLGLNDTILTIREMIDKTTASTERVLYTITYGTLLLKFDFYSNNNSEYISDLRKKLFYINCNKCQSNQYVKGRIEPVYSGGVLKCGVCDSPAIKFMWNIKVNFVDSENDIACKVNTQIVEKITCMTTEQGIIEYLNDSQALKKFVISKFHLLSGVFKISAKINEKRVEDRFYNICQYFTDGKRIFHERVKQQFKIAIQTFSKFNLLRNNQEFKDSQGPIPSFLLKNNKPTVVPDDTINKGQQKVIDYKEYIRQVQQQNSDI